MCQHRNDLHFPLLCEEFDKILKLPHIGMMMAKRRRQEKASNGLKLDVKPCPACGEYIEKNGGCNHMRCVKCDSHFCWVCGGPFQVGTTDHPTFYKCKAKRSFNASSLAEHLSESNLTMRQELQYRMQFHHSTRQYFVVKSSRSFDVESACLAGHHFLRMTYAFVYLQLETVSSQGVMKEHMKEFRNLTGLAEVCLERMESGFESNVDGLSTALRGLIVFMSKIRHYKKKEKMKKDLSSKIETRSFVRGMGTQNRLLVASSRASFRRYLESGVQTPGGWCVCVEHIRFNNTSHIQSPQVLYELATTKT